MAARTDAAAERAERVLVLTRVVDAPRELVFKAWTEREQLIHWMAPRGFTIPAADGDLRPGGAWSTTMHPPQGPEPGDRPTRATRLHPRMAGRRGEAGPRNAGHGHIRRTRREDRAHASSGCVRISRAARRSSRRLDRMPGASRRTPRANPVTVRSREERRAPSRAARGPSSRTAPS